jgi:hypothetical protein
MAQQALAPDRLQPPLVPRSGFRQQVKRSVEPFGNEGLKEAAKGNMKILADQVYWS